MSTQNIKICKKFFYDKGCYKLNNFIKISTLNDINMSKVFVSRAVDDVNVQDENKVTPLFFASKSNDFNIEIIDRSGC